MPKSQLQSQPQQIKRIYGSSGHYGGRVYSINNNKSGLGSYSFTDRHHTHKTYNYTQDDGIRTHTTYRERMNRFTTSEEDDTEETNSYVNSIPNNENESGDDDEGEYGDDDNDEYIEDDDDNADVDSYDDNDDEYDDSDEQICQVCHNQLDDTERMLKPCRCGFKICMFCLNETKICPGCKSPYSLSVLEQQQQQLLESGLRKKRDLRKKGRKDGPIQTMTTTYSGYFSPTQPQHYSTTQTIQSAPFSLSSPLMHPKTQIHQQQYSHYNSFDKRKLENVRVVQHNLVYVTNIPLNFLSRSGTSYATITGTATTTTTSLIGSATSSIASGISVSSTSSNISSSTNGSNETSILSQNEYFGQYGKIIKLVVNYSVIHNSSTSHGPTVSCYVTYLRNEDASACINAVNGAWLGGKLLRASFGTTKYCTFFLKGISCTNPDCLYLHKLGSEQDSFTKETMAAGKNLFSDCVHPKISYNDKGVNIFPPPTLAQAFASHATIPYEQAAQYIPPKYSDVIGPSRTWKSFSIVVTTTALSKKVYTGFIPTDAENLIMSDGKQQQQQRNIGSFTLEGGLDKNVPILVSENSPNAFGRQLLKKSGMFKQSSSQDDADDDDDDDFYGESNSDDSNNGGTPRSLDGTGLGGVDFSGNDGIRSKMKERNEPGISDLISFDSLMNGDRSKNDGFGRKVGDNIEFCNGFLSLNCDCATLFNVIQKQNDEDETQFCSTDFYQKMFSPKSFPQIYPVTLPSQSPSSSSSTSSSAALSSLSLTSPLTPLLSSSLLTPTSLTLLSSLPSQQQQQQQQQQPISDRRSPLLRQYSSSPSNKFRIDNINSNVHDQDFLLATTVFSNGTDFCGTSSNEFTNYNTIGEDQIQQQQKIDPNDIASQLLFGCDFAVSSLCERIFGK